MDHQVNYKWNRCMVFVYCLMTLVICFVNSSEDGEKVRLNKRAVRFCGVKLINAMKSICNHCYRDGKVKRNADFDDNNERRNFFTTISSMKTDDESASLNYIDSYIEKRYGSPMPNQIGPNGPGIANKCCINQCGWSDLKSYCCKNPKKLVSRSNKL